MTKSNILDNLNELLNGDTTAYKIAKDLDLNPTTIQRYIRKENNIENMTLKMALMLNEYYLKNKK